MSFPQDYRGYPLECRIDRFLTEDGTETGNPNMNGVYLISPQIPFWYGPEENEIVEIHRMIIMIRGGKGFRAEGYGPSPNPLLNGVEIGIMDKDDGNPFSDGNWLYKLTDLPIKSNAQWGAYCYDVSLKAWAGNQVDEFVLVRWTFQNAGIPVVLNGKYGHRICAMATESMAALGINEQTFMIQGHKAKR